MVETKRLLLREFKHSIANIITGIRIVSSVIMLFCQVFSPAFYSFYIVAGVSDMIDGIVARKTGTASEFELKQQKKREKHRGH